MKENKILLKSKMERSYYKKVTGEKDEDKKKKKKMEDIFELRKTPKDKKSGLPKKYVPKSLSKEDRKKQIKSIKEGTIRPKVKSFTSKRSPFVERFEKKFGYKINDFSRISKEIIKREGINQIIKKGEAAYFSGGSRPNQTPRSWALARLASVIVGGKARTIDKNIWNKYKI